MGNKKRNRTERKGKERTFVSPQSFSGKTQAATGNVLLLYAGVTKGIRFQSDMFAHVMV